MVITYRIWKSHKTETTDEPKLPSRKKKLVVTVCISNLNKGWSNNRRVFVSIYNIVMYNEHVERNVARMPSRSRRVDLNTNWHFIHPLALYLGHLGQLLDHLRPRRKVPARSWLGPRMIQGSPERSATYLWSRPARSTSRL